VGIKWYHHVRNDNVRWKTEQPHLLATVQTWQLSLFSHIARMPNESDAKQLVSHLCLKYFDGAPKNCYTNLQNCFAQQKSWGFRALRLAGRNEFRCFASTFFHLWLLASARKMMALSDIAGRLQPTHTS